MLYREPKITEVKPKKVDAQLDNITYQIKAKVKLDNKAIEQAKKEAGCFVIATNDVDRDWTMEELLDGYKSQHSVIRGFRFLKYPKLYADPIFVQTPERTKALLMIIVLALLVYSVTEYLLRKNLKEKHLTVAHQTGKPTTEPTLQWILMKFNTGHLGKLLSNGNLVDYCSLGKDQRTVIEALGDEWAKIYKNCM